MTSTITDLRRGFELGPWTVIPERGLLRQRVVEEHLEPMVMDVLVVLASHQGEVVTRDQLVDAVWGGRIVADEAIVAKIAALRNKLGDDSKNPQYIETIPRRGYRLKRPVKLADSDEPETRDASRTRVSRPLLIVGLVVLTIAIINWWPSAPTSIGSVAVLQFKNLSDDKEKLEHMVGGFREELVINLIQVPGLRVTRGPQWSDDKTAQKLAKELGVDAVVNGSLRADGGKIRITAELILANGFHDWADVFDGASEDILKIQARVATEVRDVILGEKGEQIRAASEPSFKAWDTYVRGLLFLGKRDMESLEHAQVLFQETRQIDPNYGPAYLRLAITYLLLSDYNLGQKHQFFDQAIKVANEGVEADPSISNSAEIIHGFVAHQRGNWAEAADAFAATFDGVTIYPDAYHWHSRLLGDLGLLDRSLEQAIAARTMDPAQQILNSRVAIAYLWINDMANARHYFEMANNMGVGVPNHHFAYALFLVRENRLEEARESVKFALDLAKLDDRWVDPIFNSLEHHDDQVLLEIAYETIEGLVASDASPYITMTLWALFEQGDRIMEIAREEAQSGNIYEIEVIYLHEFKVLREHEEFPELLQALGLTGYWSSIGCRWGNDQLLCDAA